MMILIRHFKLESFFRTISAKQLLSSFFTDSKEDRHIRRWETSSFSLLLCTYPFVWWMTISIHKWNVPVVMRSDTIHLLMVRDGAQSGIVS